MARIHKVRASSVPSGTIRHRQGHRENPSYQVRVEPVSQKKTFKTYLTYSVHPPPGYTFIPAGDPQLTRKCKKYSRLLEIPVFVVSAGASRSAELSKEIHRIGYHFSSLAVEQACVELRVTLNSSGRVNNTNFNFLAENPNDQSIHLKKGKSRSSGTAKSVDDHMPQSLVDTLGRQAIRDLFPKIPTKDLDEIVKRAFDKKSGLIGTAEGFSLARRANLAVGAHIRHTYTNYDDLLKSGDYTWQEARKAVEQFTLDKLVSWRDEGEDNPIIEEVLREVIVIPDESSNVSSASHYVQPQSLVNSGSTADIDASAIDLTMSDEDDLEESDEPYKPKIQDPWMSSPQTTAKRRDREARDNNHRQDRWKQAIDRHRTRPGPSHMKFALRHGLNKHDSAHAIERPLTNLPTEPVFNEHTRKIVRLDRDSKVAYEPQYQQPIDFENVKLLDVPENANAWTSYDTTQTATVPLTRRITSVNPMDFGLANDAVHQSSSTTHLPMVHENTVYSSSYPKVRPSIEFVDLERRAVPQSDRGLPRYERFANINQSSNRSGFPNEFGYARPPEQQFYPQPGMMLVPLENTDNSRDTSAMPSFRNPSSVTRAAPHLGPNIHVASTRSQLQPSGSRTNYRTSPPANRNRPLEQARDQEEFSGRSAPSYKKPRLVRLQEDEQPRGRTEFQSISNGQVNSSSYKAQESIRPIPNQVFSNIGQTPSSISSMQDLSIGSPTTYHGLGSRDPYKANDLATMQKPHPRLVRLDQESIPAANMATERRPFQAPLPPPNPISIRQIALGDGPYVGQVTSNRPQPPPVMTSQPEWNPPYLPPY